MPSEGVRQGLAFLPPGPQKSASAASTLDARPSEATFSSQDTVGPSERAGAVITPSAAPRGRDLRRWFSSPMAGTATERPGVDLILDMGIDGPPPANGRILRGSAEAVERRAPRNKEIQPVMGHFARNVQHEIHTQRPSNRRPPTRRSEISESPRAVHSGPAFGHSTPRLVVIGARSFSSTRTDAAPT
jgi:hypothetical protein